MADYPGWPADILGKMFDGMIARVGDADRERIERAMRSVGDIAAHIPEDDPNRMTLILIAEAAVQFGNSRRWLASGLRRLADACEATADDEDKMRNRLFASISERNARRNEEGKP
jgi:hypothetical protein